MSGSNLAIVVALVVWLVGSALQGAPSVSRPGAPSREPAGMLVAAYYVDAASYASLQAHADRIRAVSVWAWAVDASGQLRSPTADATLRQVRQAADAHGLAVHALVHNAPDGRFDGASAHALLTDPDARARAVDALAREAERHGLDGITLDLEGVPPGDREALSAFVQELADRLRRDGRYLGVAVPARTADDPSQAFSAAYDYRALGRSADGLWLMTYDEHHADGPPGPVASIGWVEQVVRYAVSRVPSRKVILGLPAYGYEWSGGQGRALTYAQAVERMARYGATLRWDGAAKAPYFIAGDRQVWFEDRYSAGYKSQLVRRYGLGGVALWRLGLEDPGVWEVIGRAR